jgi:hypothetical protein
MAEFALACILWARAEVASWQSCKNKCGRKGKEGYETTMEMQDRPSLL